MRIIVTSSGRREIKTLSPRTTTNTFYKTIHTTKSSPFLLKKHPTSPVSKIKIKQPRLSMINKFYANKDNTSTVQTETIITKAISKPKITLKEIINPSAYSAMITKMRKDSQEKQRHEVFDAQHFRALSNNRELNIKAINKIASTKNIKSDRFSLISYLNTKKNITPITLRAISKLTEEEIDHKDKICQIILYNKEKENLFKNVTENKIKINKLTYINNMKRITTDIEVSSRILDKYHNRVKKYEPYIELHDDIQRHWKNANYQRFFHKHKLNNSIDSEL